MTILGKTIGLLILLTVNVQAVQMTLTWQDNADNENALVIQRAPAVTGPFVNVSTVSSNVVTWTDTNVLQNTWYFYRVNATNTYGASAYSNIGSNKTGGIPNPPSVLIITP